MNVLPRWALPLASVVPYEINTKCKSIKIISPIFWLLLLPLGLSPSCLPPPNSRWQAAHMLMRQIKLLFSSQLIRTRGSECVVDNDFKRNLIIGYLNWGLSPAHLKDMHTLYIYIFLRWYVYVEVPPPNSQQYLYSVKTWMYSIHASHSFLLWRLRPLLIALAFSTACFFFFFFFF